MLGKKNLVVIDLDFNIKAIINGYESVVLKRVWNGISYMNISINKDMLNSNKLLEDRIVFLEGDYENAFIIERINEKLVDNSVLYEIQATHINCLLRDYITIPPTGLDVDSVTGTREVILRTWVNNNCINPQETSRKQYPIILGDLLGVGVSMTDTTRYKSLSEEIINLLGVERLGWNMLLDITNKKFVFRVLQGMDKTYSQALNKRILFGLKYGNISTYESTIDKTSEKNVCYVAGQGSGVDRVIVKLEKESYTRRKELFVDARDVEQVERLEERGRQRLEENSEVDSYNFEIVNKQFDYKQDWDLGDFVSILFKESNYVDKQIVSVIETYERGNISVTPEFGTIEKDVMKVISSLEKRIAQLEASN